MPPGHSTTAPIALRRPTTWSVRLVVGLVAAALVSCTGQPEPDGGSEAPREVGEWSLSADKRLERATMIKEAARARGLTNGILLAGIADTETGMVQCWSEATWACQGPTSPDCDGGPVIAGAGDGPCADHQGGLGMFQFDAGTFDDTLAREGDRVLTVSGNVDAAVDFVLAMVVRSQYIDGVDTEAEALAWMNEVRPWNALHHPWIQTVTHYYNGCVPGRCAAYDTKYSHYSDKTIGVLMEMGAEFWYGDDPICGTISPDGGVIDDPSLCFGAGGDPQWWRTESVGYGGGLLWTNTTDHDASSNYATWGIFVEETGRYLIEVHTDTAVAESQRARYEIVHAHGTDTVLVDQTGFDGFQALGEFDLLSGQRQSVWVGDNTGEPNAGETALVADAIRLTRVTGPVPETDAGMEDAAETDAAIPRPDAGVSDAEASDTEASVPDAPPADDDLGTDPSVGPGNLQEVASVKECGCISVAAPTPAPPLATLLVLLTILALRRRSSK